MNINDDILNMIIRHLDGNASDADDVQLQQWLAASPDNRREFEEMKAIWQASSAATFDIDADREWEKFRHKHFNAEAAPAAEKSMGWLKYASIAAAAVFLAGLFLFNSGKHYQTLAGERMSLELADGSEIMLGEQSEMYVPYLYNWLGRDVKLQGEAYFKVTPNPRKAFTIQTETTVAQVLGTEFYYIARQGENSLAVTEGLVAYWSERATDTLKLSAGEKGALRGNQLIESGYRSEELSWVRGNFSFSNSPIHEVLNQLQNYFVFNIEDQNNITNRQCLFSGSFADQPLDEILQELSLTMGLEYEFENNTLRVSQLSCN